MSYRRLLPAFAALLCSAAPAASQDGFPPGPGHDTVVAICGGCHDINRLKVGYTPDGWATVVRMMQNMEAPVPVEQWPVVQEYLTKNLPERARPAAVIVPGPVQADIKIYQVPTLGSRPHDPMAAKDGSVWWTGQLANKLGRLDPKTGMMREYTMKTPHTAPHGLVEDSAGNIWFTGNAIAIIGKLNPKTGEVTEYKMPDPAAKDPHTLIFDRNGILWFTVQQGNFVGRLDPKSGAIKLVNPPTDKARPYGMALSPKNQVFFVEFGAPKIATIDNDMKIKEWTLPNAAARPRRIVISPDGMVWYTDFARGYLGRLNPTTGEVKEWLSPSGAKSEPYGIVFTKGAFWYNESGAKPNTIVRFDPATEKFQSWAIPGGGDIVRNMDVMPNGSPVLANSLVNAVGVVTIK